MNAHFHERKLINIFDARGLLWEPKDHLKIL